MTPSKTLTKRDLLKMSQRELDDLYRVVAVPGAAPSGDTQGTVAVLPGRSFAAPMRLLARLIVWQGKVIEPDGGMLVNKILPVRARLIRAKVYRGPSWIDGGEATILDYSKTSRVAWFVRDEVREVAPRLWLGKVFVGKWHAIDFMLEG